MISPEIDDPLFRIRLALVSYAAAVKCPELNSEISEHLTRAHRQFAAMQDEIDDLRDQLGLEDK